MRLRDFLHRDFVLLRLSSRDVEGVISEVAGQAGAAGLGLEEPVIGVALVERVVGLAPESGDNPRPSNIQPGRRGSGSRRRSRGASRMSPGILLVVIVAGAYLAAHVASEWLARRHLIVSGAEYLLLGALLGPEVAGLLRASPLDGFAPFLTLAFGWVGALVGAQFHLREVIRLPAAPFSVALAQAALAWMAVAGAMAGVLVWGLGAGLPEATVPALAMGAIAVSSAPAGIAVMAQRLQARGPLIRQLHVTTAVDALASVAAFGVLLSVAHPERTSGAPPLAATASLTLSVAIGLGGGALFHLFVGNERHIDRLFIALAGALILASGAAAYLRISPLIPSFFIGLLLVNTSPSRGQILRVLTRVERPLYFVLLIFAGAAWQPVGGAGWVIAVIFVVARVLAKVSSAHVAARVLGVSRGLGRRWGWGLVGHGGVAVAVALNYRMHDASPLAGVAFTAALLSVVATDAFSARLVGALLAPRSSLGPGDGTRRDARGAP